MYRLHAPWGDFHKVSLKKKISNNSQDHVSKLVAHDLSCDLGGQPHPEYAARPHFLPDQLNQTILQ